MKTCWFERGALTFYIYALTLDKYYNKIDKDDIITWSLALRLVIHEFNYPNIVLLKAGLRGKGMSEVM